MNHQAESIWSSIGLSGMSGQLSLFLGIALILYIWTWLHNQELAKRITFIIFDMLQAAIKVLFKATVAITRGISNFFNHIYNRIFR